MTGQFLQEDDYAAARHKEDIQNSIPIFSQLKSLFQAASGDLEGAKRTQDDFMDKAPVISQAVHAAKAVDFLAQAAGRSQVPVLGLGAI